MPAAVMMAMSRPYTARRSSFSAARSAVPPPRCAPFIAVMLLLAFNGRSHHRLYQWQLVPRPLGAAAPSAPAPSAPPPGNTA